MVSLLCNPSWQKLGWRRSQGQTRDVNGDTKLCTYIMEPKIYLALFSIYISLSPGLKILKALASVRREEYPSFTWKSIEVAFFAPEIQAQGHYECDGSAKDSSRYCLYVLMDEEG